MTVLIRYRRVKCSKMQPHMHARKIPRVFDLTLRKCKLNGLNNFVDTVRERRTCIKSLPNFVQIVTNR